MNKLITENLPLVLHLRRDFEDFPNNQLVHQNLCKTIPCRRRRVRNWREFAEAIKEEVPRIITIYYKELTLADQQEPEKFINFVHGLIDYVGINTNAIIPDIAIGIDASCDKNFINRLKLVPGIKGIYWADDQVGDERTACHLALLARQQFWDLNVVAQLPIPRLINVYFREDWQKYMGKFDKTQFEDMLEMELECCTNWHELGKTMYRSPHQIVVHVDTVKQLNVTIPEIISMVDTRLKLVGLLIPVAVGIEPTTPLSVIKELKQAGVFGIVPSAAHWGLDDVNAVAKRLDVNQEAIGDIIAPYFGDADALTLTEALKGHVSILTDIIRFKKADRDTATLETNLDNNAVAIAEFLSNLDPGNWPKIAILEAIRTHIKHTMAEIDARVKQDWEADFAAYDMVRDSIKTIADTMSAGIVNRFPEKFDKYDL